MNSGLNTKLPMIAAIVAFLASCLGPGAAAQTYTATDLGTLRAGSARIHDVNESGQAVGASGHPHGAETHAFFWQKQGGIRDLGTLPGGDYSSAFAINASGVVVGTSNMSTSTHAFSWTPAEGSRPWNVAGRNCQFGACHQQSRRDRGKFWRTCGSVVWR